VGLILDTNALSAIAQGEPGATNIFARARQVAIPVIVLGEYRFGITHSRHKREYERWLEEMVSVCRMLEINEETALWYAGLRVQLKQAGTPIPSNDAWIGALCRQHALPLMSRDRHFDLIQGLQRVDW
jgi:predicted nucleic acid-binding protein